MKELLRTLKRKCAKSVWKMCNQKILGNGSKDLNLKKKYDSFDTLRCIVKCKCRAVKAKTLNVQESPDKNDDRMDCNAADCGENADCKVALHC